MVAAASAARSSSRGSESGGRCIESRPEVIRKLEVNRPATAPRLGPRAGIFIFTELLQTGSSLLQEFLVVFSLALSLIYPWSQDVLRQSSTWKGEEGKQSQEFLRPLSHLMHFQELSIST